MTATELASWPVFAERNFLSPVDSDDPDSHLALSDAQKAAVNSIQWGYDLVAVPEWYEPKHVPMGVVMLFPRQHGKTTAIAAAAACILILEDNARVAIMSNAEDSAKDVFDRIIDFIERSRWKYLMQRCISDTVWMHNGSRLKSYPNSESIRGKSLRYLILDEAAQIDPKVIDAALPTTRRAGKRWIMLSTPRGIGGDFISNYFRGLSSRPVVCAKCRTEFPQTTFNADFHPRTIPPLPDCPECGANDYFYGVGMFSVATVDPWTCSWKTREEIQRELDERGNTPQARQEILGEILSEGSMVFLREWLENCTGTSMRNILKPKKEDYVIGVDFGKVYDASVAVVMHERDGKKYLDYIHAWSTRAKAHKKGDSVESIDYHEIREDLLRLVEAYKPKLLVLDGTGCGQGVADEVYHDLRTTSPYTRLYNNTRDQRGFIFHRNSKLDLVEKGVLDLEKALVRMPPENEPGIRELWRELLAFSWDRTSHGNVKFGTQSEHDDRVIAFLLALEGLRTNTWVTYELHFDTYEEDFSLSPDLHEDWEW